MSSGPIPVSWRTALPSFADIWDERAGGWHVATVPGSQADPLGVWVVPFMFTFAVVVGPEGAMHYNDRWCYKGVVEAFAAARAWKGPYPGTEPSGWHRHPTTGRRRDEEGERVQP